VHFSVHLLIWEEYRPSDSAFSSLLRNQENASQETSIPGQNVRLVAAEKCVMACNSRQPKHAVTGFLHQPMAERFASAMIMLLQDPHKAWMMEKIARRHVQKNFSWKIFGAWLNTIIHELFGINWRFVKWRVRLVTDFSGKRVCSMTMNYNSSIFYSQSSEHTHPYFIGFHASMYLNGFCRSIISVGVF
jgi:hypothetical protein